MSRRYRRLEGTGDDTDVPYGPSDGPPDGPSDGPADAARVETVP
jgi:hypothetical protein